MYEEEKTGILNSSRFLELLKVLEDVVSSMDSSAIDMPNGVPEPGNYPLDEQGSYQAKLATVAVGWAFLHEICHLQHQHERAGSMERDQKSQVMDEFLCDEFATKFLLDKIEDYAFSVKADTNKVLQLRQHGIYCAFFAMVLLAKDQWGKSTSHPALQDRINRIQTIMAGNRSETAEAASRDAFQLLQSYWQNAPSLNQNYR